MKSVFAILIFAFISISVSGQMNRDSLLNTISARKKDTSIHAGQSLSDSVTAFPDTLIIKIPAPLAQTFLNVVNQNDKDISLLYYKALVQVVATQIRKQVIKKPKK